MSSSGQSNKCPFSSSGSASPLPSPEAVVTQRPTPGPSKLIAFDSNIDPLAFLGDLVERYGDVVRYQTRFGPCILFVHPEHVQTVLHRENYRRASLVKMMLGEGLLAIDGPRWRSQRRLMQRDFMPAKMPPFVSVMIKETTRTTDAWQAGALDGAVVDLTASMARLTLRIVVKSLFSDDLSEAQSAELCDAVTQTINDLGNISRTVFGVPVMFTPGSNASFAAGKNVIDRTCYDMISRRKALAPENRPDDLLTLLIEAETDDGPMDDRQLRDEIVTMLVAGHETTALVLTWAWKALSEHPESEARLHEEVDQVLAGRLPGLDDIPNLPWTRAVFQEAMRLYPPVWYMARVANEDDVIDGHAIPRGACVLVSAWLTHRHKNFWTAPDQFDPSRFVDPAVAPAHRYAYFPFGGGRHQCLGMHFSLIEGTILLAQLAEQFRVRPIEGQQIRPDPGITLRQSSPMLVTVEPRGARLVPMPSESEAA